jgi:hypothetical protein
MQHEPRDDVAKLAVFFFLHSTVCVCPDATMHVSDIGGQRQITAYMLTHTTARILRYMCPHATICVAAYYDICVLMLLLNMRL